MYYRSFVTTRTNISLEENNKGNMCTRHQMQEKQKNGSWRRVKESTNGWVWRLRRWPRGAARIQWTPPGERKKTHKVGAKATASIHLSQRTGNITRFTQTKIGEPFASFNRWPCVLHLPTAILQDEWRGLSNLLHAKLYPWLDIIVLFIRLS